jgi:hypothetical protein
MTTAHELAREISGDTNCRYSKALSQAMKILYHNISLKKEVKDLPNTLKELITDKVHTTNEVVFNKLKKFAYKSWPTNTGWQMFFSNNIINALN